MLACARVERNRGRTCLQQITYPFLNYVRIVARARLNRDRDIPRALLSCCNNFLSQGWIFNERRARTLPLHRTVGAAHVDVYAAESELYNKRGALLNRLRSRAKDLRNNGPLALVVQKINEQFLSPR